MIILRDQYSNYLEWYCKDNMNNASEDLLSYLLGTILTNRYALHKQNIFLKNWKTTILMSDNLFAAVS